MRNLFTIWRRELAACFLSPVAYVTMVVFLAVSGGTFLSAVVENVGTAEPLVTQLFAAIIVWLTVLVTVVSMRLFSEEKNSGTIETLMTAPVTETEVVLGKYGGALTFVLVVSAAAVSSIFILAALSPGIDFVDIGAVSGGCLILFLVSALCVSIGLFVSLMTRNQIVAAICIFCAVWLVLLFGWLISNLPFGLKSESEYISCMAHVEEFARGSVDTGTTVMYLSGTVLMLFGAVRLLESMRWK